MPDVTLSAGALSYEDSGGDGPVVVMVGGLAMDALMWRKVVAELSPAHRCLVLTLPLGSHRQPMEPDSDLSTRGLARLEGEFLKPLDLRDVTLVGNESYAKQGAAIARLKGKSTRTGDPVTNHQGTPAWACQNITISRVALT